MARELAFSMRVDGFDEPIIARVSFDGFDEPIIALEKLRVFEDPFFCEVQFKGRREGLKVNTTPTKG